MRSVLTVVFVWSMFIPALSAAPASGEAVYKQRCAGCHDSGSGRIPPSARASNCRWSIACRRVDRSGFAPRSSP